MGKWGKKQQLAHMATSKANIYFILKKQNKTKIIKKKTLAAFPEQS